MHLDFSGKRILVIGGTGFVGSRLVEQLIVECGASVRVLVRNFASAVRIGRFPVEMIHGDITVPNDVAAAVEDCDVVFHCAYGNSGDGKEQRQVTVEGTKNVMAAAQRLGTKRVVYLSTLSVYGRMSDGDLDESAPRHKSSGYYGATKSDAETIVTNYAAQGLPVAILQPTIIYGPYGPLWTVGILERLKNGGVTVIDGGNGLCNIVYIDDVVKAMLLAATKDEAVGETFLISGNEPVTWRDFYEAYEKMLGMSSRIVSLSANEAKSFYRKDQSERGLLKQTKMIIREEETLRDRLISTPELTKLLRTIRVVLPERFWTTLKQSVKGGNTNEVGPLIFETGVQSPVLPEAIHPHDIELVQAKTRVQIDKAKRLLGYNPSFDFEKGMQITEQWARWANLLN